MASVRTMLPSFAATCSVAAAARAEEAATPPGTLGLGIEFGTGLVVLLAVLIGASVVAKLLIVFGAVPRQPESGFHALVHGMANFVGGLTRPRPRRRDATRRDDR